MLPPLSPRRMLPQLRVDMLERCYMEDVSISGLSTFDSAEIYGVGIMARCASGGQFGHVGMHSWARSKHYHVCMYVRTYMQQGQLNGPCMRAGDASELNCGMGLHVARLAVPNTAWSGHCLAVHVCTMQCRGVVDKWCARKCSCQWVIAAIVRHKLHLSQCSAPTGTERSHDQRHRKKPRPKEVGAHIAGSTSASGCPNTNGTFVRAGGLPSPKDGIGLHVVCLA